MQLALVNNKRTPPSPKLKGKCPVCGQDVIAKCGKYRRFHWAHESKENCDFWKEHETNWHIDWKNNSQLNGRKSFIQIQFQEKNI